jgi:hypothetical protein
MIESEEELAADWEAHRAEREAAIRHYEAMKQRSDNAAWFFLIVGFLIGVFILGH